MTGATRQRQATALRFACGTAPDTMHRRFWTVEKSPIRGLLLTSGLTVNR